MSGTETVLQVLEDANFKRLPKPLVVGGTTFDFEAAVKGTGVSHDLVVVADTSTSSDRLLRLMTGLTRALDHLESQMPVSLILVGLADGGPNRVELERFARVLVVEDAEPKPQQVRQAVAILLPLSIPPSGDRAGDPAAELNEKLGRSATREHAALINASGKGADSVRDELRTYIDGAARFGGEGADD